MWPGHKYNQCKVQHSSTALATSFGELFQSDKCTLWDILTLGSSLPSRQVVALANPFVNPNTHEVKYKRFLTVDKTTQCANFRHRLPSKKRRTDRSIIGLQDENNEFLSQCYVRVYVVFGSFLPRDRHGGLVAKASAS